MSGARASGPKVFKVTEKNVQHEHFFFTLPGPALLSFDQRQCAKMFLGAGGIHARACPAQMGAHAKQSWQCASQAGERESGTAIP
jgi:hypothetical protein